MTTGTTTIRHIRFGICDCGEKCFPENWLECIPCNKFVCQVCQPSHTMEHKLKDKGNNEERFKKAIMNFTSGDRVDHPSHYHKGTYEAINVIEAWDLEFCLGNAVKYISRAGHKDATKEIEDLEKALWYLSRRIEFLKKKKVEEASKMMETYKDDGHTHLIPPLHARPEEDEADA